MRNRLASLYIASSLLFLCLDSTKATDIMLVGQPTPSNTRTDTLAQGGFGFSLKSSIQVDRLGFWVSPADSGNTGKLAVSHSVALYHYIGGANYTELASATIPANSTGDADQFAWANITPVTLTDTSQSGDMYVLVASQGTDTWGPTTGTTTYASVPGSAYVTLTGNGMWTTAAMPGVGNTVALVPAVGNNYAGPNMGFVAVPEPSTYALGAIATGVMAAIARRRKARKC